MKDGQDPLGKRLEPPGICGNRSGSRFNSRQTPLRGVRMKRILASLLAALLLNICVPSVRAQQQPNREEKHIKKIKKEVAFQKRWNPEDPITVSLQDGSKVKGYIAEVFDDHFMLTDRRGRQPISVDYAQVKETKTGFGRNSKIALGIGGAVLGIMAICLISRRCVN